MCSCLEPEVPFLSTGSERPCPCPVAGARSFPGWFVGPSSCRAVSSPCVGCVCCALRVIQAVCDGGSRSAGVTRAARRCNPSTNAFPSECASLPLGFACVVGLHSFWLSRTTWDLTSLCLWPGSLQSLTWDSQRSPFDIFMKPVLYLRC